MARRKYFYTKEFLEEVVKDSYSMWEVMRKLERGDSYSTRDELKRTCIELGISMDHFLANGHPERRRKPQRLTDAEIFSVRPELLGYSKSGDNKRATRRLVALGKSYECDICHISTWQDKPIKLQLEHMNGNSFDYRKENLAFLCPNCHSQTGTFGGGNKSRIKELNEIEDTTNT